MNRILSVMLILFLFDCQVKKNQKFNLGFENQSDESTLPDGWFSSGNYVFSIDKSCYSGSKCGKLTSDKIGSSYGGLTFEIPANYRGLTIRLDGYMKTKNVTDGFAGLHLHIEGSRKLLVSDVMEKDRVTGTTNWQKYSIRQKYPTDAKIIRIGGVLTGKGEAWFDDFDLSIDGKNVQFLEEVDRSLPKAELDKEFDEGSKISISQLSHNTLNSLELLGRVWGFLKYHHPEIAKGNYNWDYELFRILPDYLGIKNSNIRNEFLIKWINSLGEIKECLTCTKTDEKAILKPDLRWIDKQNKILKESLISVYARRNHGKHRYVDKAPNVGNPIFQNENDYISMPYPDDGFRLLSLFRYWNMIHYYFPYKHLMDEDWNLKLKEYIPKFLNAKNELEYELVTLELIGDIQDSHAIIWAGNNRINEKRGNNIPPIHVRFVENKLTVTDFYNAELKEETGLEIGDVITSIDGKTIEQIIIDESKYYPASNVPAKLRDMSSNILRSTSNSMTVSFVRSNTKEGFNKKLTLFPRDKLNVYRWYPENNTKCYRMLDNNIGYITLQTIKKEDIADIKEKFHKTKGIIIDIRNYPSTFVPFTLGSYFISGTASFVKFGKVNTNNPGEFNFTKELEIRNYGKAYSGKLIVLVNEFTQSQAEYTAMAFRAGDNTTIIGSTTAGADGNISEIVLPGGLKTYITGIGVYYPNGEETQRIGIIPDIEVKPTIKGIKDDKDELLDKAIELILGEERLK